MDAILRFLKSSTWFQTLAMKGIRHGATAAGAAVLALAVNHGVGNETATDLQNEIIGLVVTLGGLALSYWDGKVVSQKIVTAAVQGVQSGIVISESGLGPQTKAVLEDGPPPKTIADLQARVAAGGTV